MLGRTSQWMPLGVLAIALGYAVLHGGGRSPVDWNVSMLLIGLVALVHWLRTNPAERAPSVGPWLGGALVLAPAYVASQLVPLPLFLLGILSPMRAQTVVSLGTVMPAPAFASLSVNGAVTFAHLLNIITYTISFLLVREIVWRFRQRRSWAAASPLIAIAAIEAGLGLWQAAGGAHVQGTYRNKNHFAGLLEMVLPMTVAYAIALLTEKRFRGASRGLRALGGCAVLGIAGVILLGLGHSLSRMGFVAGLCGLFVTGALALATTFQGTKKWLSMASLTGCGLLAFFAIPTDPLVSRFGYLFDDLATGGGRWPIWRDTLHLFSAYPLFGSGLGNYGTAFLKYQTTTVDLAFTFAHNDYLQLASELGALGFSIFIGLMLIVLMRAIRAGTQAGEWNTRALGLGCVGAIAAIAIHSLADFNMYIPANALLLAWISGIAASLATGSGRDLEVPSHAFFRKGRIVCTCLLVVYASASILAETAFRKNLQAKQLLCRFGICYTGAAVDSQKQQKAGAVPAPITELLEVVRTNAIDPHRWCDLGKAMFRSGRVEQARTCFSNALALGPNIPPVLLMAANFYHDVGENKRALLQTSRVLEKTDGYDAVIFNWYREKKMPVAEILADGLPSAPRASQAYLRYLIRTRNFGDAAIAWTWLLAHTYADDRVANDYVNFLYGDRRYETAARSWALYLGDRRNGYLESNWLLNGGFESETSRAVFDWRMEDLTDDVKVTLDASVARTGSRSLRIRFGGQENVSYTHTSQTTVVTPGAYRFQAFVRAQDITTDQGIGFHIFDPEASGRVDVRTEQVVGTNDWKTIDQTVRVPDETRLLVVQIVRPRSWKFDSHIGGTAWIDDMSLAKVE